MGKIPIKTSSYKKNYFIEAGWVEMEVFFDIGFGETPEMAQRTWVVPRLHKNLQTCSWDTFFHICSSIFIEKKKSTGPLDNKILCLTILHLLCEQVSERKKKCQEQLLPHMSESDQLKFDQAWNMHNTMGRSFHD